jgi:hypothetical protein
VTEPRREDPRPSPPGDLSGIRHQPARRADRTSTAREHLVELWPWFAPAEPMPTIERRHDPVASDWPKRLGLCFRPSRHFAVPKRPHQTCEVRNRSSTRSPNCPACEHKSVSRAVPRLFVLGLVVGWSPSATTARVPSPSAGPRSPPWRTCPAPGRSTVLRRSASRGGPRTHRSALLARSPGDARRNPVQRGRRAERASMRWRRACSISSNHGDNAGRSCAIGRWACCRHANTVWGTDIGGEL